MSLKERPFCMVTLQDISLSTAVDHVGMYLRHVEAEKKTLKDKLDKLEKDFAKLKNK
jgi:hypothetical protein